jgi:uncharacterized LabA/DUF88 family protein
VATRLLRLGRELTGRSLFHREHSKRPAYSTTAAHVPRAFRAATKVEIVLGRFQEKQRICRNYGFSWRTYEEKETDVAIAVALLEDGVNDRFDTAIIVSADSDLCPAVRALKRLRPDKRIVAVFPPQRRSDDLRRAADAHFTLGDAIIRQSLLPSAVDGKGTIYRRPSHWV